MVIIKVLFTGFNEVVCRMSDGCQEGLIEVEERLKVGAGALLCVWEGM